MTTSSSGSSATRLLAVVAQHDNQQQQQLPPNEDAIEWVQQRCLGKRLLCTMNDGRQAWGILTCIDRLNNLILIDCIERRMIKSTDYNNKQHVEETQVVSRSLPQAMIPGHLLVRVEMMMMSSDVSGIE